jgi:hypothetical protein
MDQVEQVVVDILAVVVVLLVNLEPLAVAVDRDI